MSVIPASIQMRHERWKYPGFSAHSEVRKATKSDIKGQKETFSEKSLTAGAFLKE
jgi:hypothetical protein